MPPTLSSPIPLLLWLRIETSGAELALKIASQYASASFPNASPKPLRFALAAFLFQRSPPGTHTATANKTGARGAPYKPQEKQWFKPTPIFCEQ
jgi:hypothetical protein